MSRTIISPGPLVVLSLGVTLLGAQPQQPTFRSATELVEVTVTVVDKKGNAVTGLEPADFVVLDNGRARPVAVFSFDGGRARPAAAGATVTTLPAATFSNRPLLTDDAPRNVTALVLDNINTTPLQSVRARAQAMRYLQVLAPQTVTAVYLLGEHLYVLHDFTDDAAALRERLERARLPSASGWEVDERQAAVEAEAFLKWFPEHDRDLAQQFMHDRLRVDAMADAAIRRDRRERSLRQIEALGAHLAGIPGRKSLVWIGGGFSMVAVTESRGRQANQKYYSTPELQETSEEQVRQVSRRLAQQNIVLYIVAAQYLEAPSDTRAESRHLFGRGNPFDLAMDLAATSRDTTSAMQAMAAVTGGRYFYPNDVTSGVDKVVADLQGSYTLGFYLPEKPDNRWHRLKVQVKRPGLSLRYREGYLAASNMAQPTTWTDATWRTAFSNPLGSAAIPLTAECTRTPAGELTVTVSVDSLALQFLPEGETLEANLEILIGDNAADGWVRASRSAETRTVPVSGREAAGQQATRFVRTWKPAADATALRVIVRDAHSGRHGSLEVPLRSVPRDHPK